MMQLIVAFLFLCLMQSAKCTLTHTQGTTSTLLQYGSAESAQFFLLEVDRSERLVNATLYSLHTSIITSYIINTDVITDTLLNVSATLFFEALPGEAQYTISVETESFDGGRNSYSLERNHSVYGMAFYDDSNGTMALISGDFGYGLNLASDAVGHEAVRLKYVANFPEDVEFNPSAHVLLNRVRGGILKDEDVSIDEKELSIVLRPYHTGSALIIVESSNLVVDGESFETVVIVRVVRTPHQKARKRRWAFGWM